jgi:hypothetical protein
MTELTDEQRLILRNETLAHDIKEAILDIVYADGFDGRGLQKATDAALAALLDLGRTFPFAKPTATP